MARHLVIKEEEDDQAPDPIDFDLAGDNYLCQPLWPAAAVLDIANAIENMNPDDPAAMVSQLTMLGKFFSLVLEPESAIRLEAAMRRKDRPVTLRKALAAYQQLLTEYMGKDLGGSNESPSGPPPSGPSSTDVVPQPVLTP